MFMSRVEEGILYLGPEEAVLTPEGGYSSVQLDTEQVEPEKVKDPEELAQEETTFPYPGPSSF